MSFNDASRPNASKRKPLLDTRDAPDIQRVQEAVRKMRTAASDIQKEARAIGAPGRVARGVRRRPEERQRDEESRQKVDQAYRMAQGAGEEAGSLLKEIDAAGEAAKGQKGRLFHQKLSEELKSATDAVALAFEAYDALARELAGAAGEGSELTAYTESPELPRGQVPAAAMAPAQAAAPSRGLVASFFSRGASSAAAPMAQSQVLEPEVSDAEVATQVAVVDEYVTAVTSVSKEVGLLHGAMQDLAAHTVAQGQVLDTIDGNVAESRAATSDANVELVAAEQKQQWGNKCLVCVLCSVVTLSIIVIVVVAIQS